MNREGLPSNFVGSLQSLQSYRKRPIRILTTSTASQVRSSGTIKFHLPIGVFDLKTFCIHFDAKTRFNDAAPPTGPAAGDRRIVGFPKYMQSLVKSFEIWVNGKNTVNIPEFGRVYSILQDFKVNKNRKLGNNADPSYKSVMTDAGAITTYATKYATANATVNASEGKYCIDEFLGWLNPENCEIIDTNLLGTVEIVLNLNNGNNVLWAARNDGSQVEVGANLDFILENIVGYVDKIDWLDDAYIDVMRSMISTDNGLRMSFKNYMVYSGDETNQNKNIIIKASEHCECLDKIYLTFYNSDTATSKEPLQLSENEAFSTNLIANRESLANTSAYFVRNGLGVSTVQFEINSENITEPLNITQQWHETLKAMELNHSDDLKNVNPAMCLDFNHYLKEFYVCVLSTSHINNKNGKKYMTGINTQSTSMNLVCKITGEGGNDPAKSAIPYLITEFTSSIFISGQRQIMFRR